MLAIYFGELLVFNICVPMAMGSPPPPASGVPVSWRAWQCGGQRCQSASFPWELPSHWPSSHWLGRGRFPLVIGLVGWDPRQKGLHGLKSWRVTCLSKDWGTFYYTDEPGADHLHTATAATTIFTKCSTTSLEGASKHLRRDTGSCCSGCVGSLTSLVRDLSWQLIGSV